MPRTIHIFVLCNTSTFVLIQHPVLYMSDPREAFSPTFFSATDFVLFKCSTFKFRFSYCITNFLGSYLDIPNQDKVIEIFPWSLCTAGTFLKTKIQRCQVLYIYTRGPWTARPGLRTVSFQRTNFRLVFYKLIQLLHIFLANI